MGDLPAPFHLATLGGAILWPLAAGFAVVVWSKARAAARAKRIANVEDDLKSLYRDIEASPLPNRLTLVVDALEEGEELTANHPRSGSRKGTPAGS